MKTRKRPSRIYCYILHQIMNEKRSNWALLAELLIVSSVVWYLVDCTYVMIVRATLAAGRFITCAAISYALMLLIIGLGIWFPALKAVKAEPVEVLRGE